MQLPIPAPCSSESVSPSRSTASTAVKIGSRVNIRAECDGVVCCNPIIHSNWLAATPVKPSGRKVFQSRSAPVAGRRTTSNARKKNGIATSTRSSVSAKGSTSVITNFVLT